MYKGNEMAWLGYAELQMSVILLSILRSPVSLLLLKRRRNDMEGARSVFERASKLHFQYPEYIFEAFIAFEHEYGSVEEFETTERQIRKQMKGVMNKRMRVSQQLFPSSMRPYV